MSNPNFPFGRHWLGGLIVLSLILAGIGLVYLWGKL